MVSRIGAREAASRLTAAGYGVTQMEKGTLFVCRGRSSYGLTWRHTLEGDGYASEAIDALVAMAAKESMAP